MTGPASPGRPRDGRPSDAPSPKDELQRLYFGEFSAEVDGSRCHGLFRGQEPVGLSDVPRKVLFILLQHRPRPVTAKALLKELWHPGANPSNVAKQVRALRVAMGDERSGLYMRTLKKEGYAFVMPVTESPGRRSMPGAPAAPTGRWHAGQAPVRSTNGGLTKAPTRTEWRLAKEKLAKDFRGSCLHDLELLEEAIKECRSRIRLIAEHRRLPLDGRFPHEPVLVPPRSTAGGRWAKLGEPDNEVASSAADLIGYSRATPIIVNVGSYAPACISVLQSLRRRYGLDVRSDFEDLSGRQQILRLHYDDEADFLLAPHAPFLLVGDHGALNYRWVTPVHAYEQAVLQAPGPARGRRRKLLVYQGGSPEEQLLAGAGIPGSTDPEIVTSLETLIASVQALPAGDMVVAWEPLASGLESQHLLRRLGGFRLWISLYCHKRWQRGALRPLKDQFRRLFAGEWIYCRKNPQWAIECLAVELKALEFFTAGSGLGFRP